MTRAPGLHQRKVDASGAVAQRATRAQAFTLSAAQWLG